MNAGIYIGAHKDSIVEARKAICEILDRKPESSLGVAALQTLHTLCAVQGTTVTQCQITSGNKPRVRQRKQGAK